MLKDTYKEKGKRNRLVEELITMGIQSTSVLKAIQHVPRHFFFPKDFADKAYENIAFPIDKKQTISQPYTVAKQTELLDIQTGEKVLEIGTGSGYQAAVLKVMGVHLHTIETIPTLHQKAKILFSKLGLTINAVLGDGSLGLPELAPFDKIIITAGAPELKENLLKQLKIGGKIVAPVGSLDVQKMILIHRIGDNEYTETDHGNFNFVPLTGFNGWTIT